MREVLTEDLVVALEDAFRRSFRWSSYRGHVIATYKSQLPIAYFSVAFGVGAALETKEVAGISHFIEHLVFKGSSKFKVGEIAKLINSLGGYLNAYTSYDHTNYYSIVPADNLENVMEAIYDMTLHPSFPPDEVENEREVVMEEIRQSEDEPISKSFKRLMEVMFPEHPFGKPILGYFHTVANLSRETILQFWRRYYSLPNSVTLVVSPHEHEEVKDMVRGFLEGVEIPEDARTLKMYLSELRKLSMNVPESSAEEERLRGRLNRSYVLGGSPGSLLIQGNRISGKYIREYLSLASVSAGRSSPLKIRLKEELKLADQISMDSFSIGIRNVVLFSASCEPGNEQHLIEELVSSLKSIQLSEAHMRRVKGLIANSEISSLESVEWIAGKLLDGVLLDYPNLFLDELRELLKVKPDELKPSELIPEVFVVHAPSP